MNLCFKCTVDIKIIYKSTTAISKVTLLYTWQSQMQPHSSGQWCYLGFGKENTKGIPGCRKNHTSCPLRKYFIGFGASSSVLQARCSQSRKVEWLISFLLLLSGTSTIEAFPQTRLCLVWEALVCATAHGCAWGTIPGKSHTELGALLVGSQLWARGLYKDQRIQLWSCHLSLWYHRHLPKLLRASLISFTSSPVLVPTMWCLSCENFTFLAVSGTCLVEKKGRIPIRHLFFYRNSGQTPAFYQCWISFGWKVKRAALPKHKTTQQTSFGCLMNGFT